MGMKSKTNVRFSQNQKSWWSKNRTVAANQTISVAHLFGPWIFSFKTYSWYNIVYGRLVRFEAPFEPV